MRQSACLVETPTMVLIAMVSSLISRRSNNVQAQEVSMQANLMMCTTADSRSKIWAVK